MAKKNDKVVKEMTNEEAAKLFDGGNEHNMADKKVELEVEEGKEMELELDAEKSETTEVKEEELEFEIEGDELEEEMEDMVKEKVEAEEKQNKEQKHKPGPKPGGSKKEKEKAETDGEEKPKEKKPKELDLNNPNIIEREIKKGRLSAPQGRIEKTDKGYKILVSDGIIFPKDQNWKHEDTVSIMHEGKYITTMKFENLAEDGKFKAKHENGSEVSHGWVRVELHKPGREKDVVELFNLSSAQQKLSQREKIKSEKVADKKEEKE